MDECVYIGCGGPPAPEGLHVKSDWDGFSLYKFGATATYTCESERFFFESDRQMESFAVKCLEGGRWEEPSPAWPRCVSGE